MNPPEFEQTLTGYTFFWKQEKIAIVISNLSYKHDSLKGEVRVKTSLPGYNEHLHQANFNFSSTRAKTDLVRTLSNICEEIQWDILIEQLRVKVLGLYREGEPVEIINSKDEISNINYILFPLIPENLLTLIYWEGCT